MDEIPLVHAMNDDQKGFLEEIRTAHGQLSLAHITKVIAEAAESFGYGSPDYRRIRLRSGSGKAT